MLVAMVKSGSVLDPLGVAGVYHDSSVDNDMLHVPPREAVPAEGGEYSSLFQLLTLLLAPKAVN